MYYGGDYNPEQWDESVWLDDVRLMREAGVNIVTLAVFSWSRIQPDEHTFDFGWLDRIIDLLHENGVDVDLATATASLPPWAAKQYPDILPQDENGITYWPGSRQAYSPSSPDYRRLAARLVTALVERYHAHPAVVMWHVNNEYGCHLSYDYSDNAARHFRLWLKRGYGDIESLNRAWGTDFWSQRYGSFEEIVPPRKAPHSVNPAGLLDFKRFTSDTSLELFVIERDIIKGFGASQPVTTNFMGAFSPHDYWKWAAELDVLSDDNYYDPNDPQSFRNAAFARDLMRSLKPGTPWLLMEQATNSVSWNPSNAPKAPGQMAALSMQAVGRGANGILFFQWRQSRRGSEKFLSSMVPQAGLKTRTWREVKDLGETLRNLPALSPAPHEKSGAGSGARVAVVFDWQNWWAISSPDHPVQLNWIDLVQRWYSALHRQNIAVDFVRPTDDLSDYSLVLLLHSYLLTEAAAHSLTEYVEGGGRLFVTPFSDIVDEDDAFREGGFQVGLRKVLGITVDDFGALMPPSAAQNPARESAVSGATLPGQNETFVEGPFGLIRGQHVAEELRILVEDVVVEARFSSGRTAGLPALTTRASGLGVAHYLATIPDDVGMLSIARWLAHAAGVESLLAVPNEWVEVARRADVLTIINHGVDPVSVAVAGVDVTTEKSVVAVELAQYDWAMVRVSDQM